jgi:hypothetical protein
MTSRLAELSAGVTDFAPEAVLIQPETALPRGLDIGLRRLPRWNFVVADTWWLERRLREAGWHFFFLDGTSFLWSLRLRRLLSRSIEAALFARRSST